MRFGLVREPALVRVENVKFIVLCMFGVFILLALVLRRVERLFGKLGVRGSIILRLVDGWLLVGVLLKVTHF